MLGVDADSDVGRSALGEIGNILGTSYVQSLAQVSGLELAPAPPQLASDMLGAIVASVMAEQAQRTDVALVLDSELTVEGEPCSLSFLLLPELGGVTELLGRLGL
jgi:chemotaxis protein CheC